MWLNSNFTTKTWLQSSQMTNTSAVQFVCASNEWNFPKTESLSTRRNFSCPVDALTETTTRQWQGTGCFFTQQCIVLSTVPVCTRNSIDKGAQNTFLCLVKSLIRSWTVMARNTTFTKHRIDKETRQYLWMNYICIYSKLTEWSTYQWFKMQQRAWQHEHGEST